MGTLMTLTYIATEIDVQLTVNREKFVVYADLGLIFHQILQRQLLWVKGRIALYWVVNAANNQIVI